MLQDGGMLVQPGFGGIRQGYRGEKGYQGGATEGPDDRSTEEQTDRTKEAIADARDARAKENIDKMFTGLRQTITPSTQLGNRLARIGLNVFGLPTGVPLGEVFAKTIDKQQPDIFGTKTDDDDDDRGEGERYVAPTFAQTRITPGLPAAVQPMQTMDLNRIAYRLMADGGFLDDENEPRQAYGLGSFVKKVVKKATTVPRKVFKTVKKVAKSPTGRLLLAIAAPYALGPAMAQSQFLAGLSAAQKAALVSGATTGITQLASGEDLDLKEIGLSAALSGGISKLTTPAATGIDPSSAAGRARVASDVSARSVIPDRAMGQIPARTNLFDEVALTRGETILPQPKPSIIPDRGMGQIFERAAPKDTGILQAAKDAFTNVKDSKITDILLRNQEGKISPLKSILLASTLAGAVAKKEQEPDEFTEMDRGPGIDVAAIRGRPFDYMAPRFAGSQFDFYAAEGGQAKKEPVAKKVMPLLDMGGMEKDYREEGGFVPIGRMEKADDVPARLSKNEFVFTADAVRNAGDGDVDKGAEVMYNMMKNLEAGGDVSEESQGLQGARRMFQTSQRLEEVL
jgi:hypothetical protein